MTDLSQAFEDCLPKPKIRVIVGHIAKMTGVPQADILSAKRDKPTARARQMVMWKAHKEGHSLSDIGRVLNRHHTSILFGIRQINRRLET